MAWIKCTPMFKHGKGSPVYREVGDMKFLDEIKEEMYDEYCDPDGFRAAEWEILENLPSKYLLERISDARQSMMHYANEFDRLTEMFDKAYGDKSD